MYNLIPSWLLDTYPLLIWNCNGLVIQRSGKNSAVYCAKCELPRFYTVTTKFALALFFMGVF